MATRTDGVSGGGGTDVLSQRAEDPSTGGKTAKPSSSYVIFAAVAIFVGVVAGQIAVHAEVRYTAPAVGVSVFAVLYVLAQSVERLVEWIITAIDLVNNGFAEGKKKAALEDLRRARSTANGNPNERDLDVTPAAADAKKEVEAARKDLGLFGQALSFAFAYTAVSYFEYGVFSAIGITNIVPGVDRVFTALAVMGGSKALHDLISKIQKSKEKDETQTQRT